MMPFGRLLFVDCPMFFGDPLLLLLHVGAFAAPPGGRKFSSVRVSGSARIGSRRVIRFF